MRSFESLETEHNEPPDDSKDLRYCRCCDLMKVEENEDGEFICEDCADDREEARMSRNLYGRVVK